MGYLAVGIVDCVGVIARGNLRHPVYLRHRILQGGDDVCQAGVDFGVWALADNAHLTIDYGDASC